MSFYEHDELYQGLILLLLLRFPQAQAIDIHHNWFLSVVTREYPEPSYGELQQLVRQVKASL